MIKLININKTYGKKKVLKNINYTFENEGIYVLEGESGCGKTTLLKIIASRIKKDSGSIKSDDDIFFIPYDHYFIDNFKIKEIIKLHQDLIPSFQEYKNKFGLEKLMDRKIKKMSQGEKQKLIVFLALSSNIKHILLDEPLSGVDESSKKQIIKELKNVSKDRLIIISSHQKIENSKTIILKDASLHGRYKDKLVKNQSNVIRKMKLNNWAVLLHQKQAISKIILLISLFSIYLLNNSFNKELSIMYNEVENSFSNEKISYKSNNGKLDMETFYGGIVSNLAIEVKEYHINVYSRDMLKEKIMVDTYYIGDGMVLSFPIENHLLNEDEIILQLNKINFCTQNQIHNCLETSIKNKLIGKYVRFDEYSQYKIKDIVFADKELIQVNNKNDFINDLMLKYNNVYLEYYLEIKKEYLDSFYHKINLLDSLLKYEFVLITETMDSVIFTVKEAEHTYFSHDELKRQKYIACTDIGYSCNAFNFSKLTSLTHIDNQEFSELIKYDIYKKDLTYKEIALSSSLANALNKSLGDYISLEFYFDKEFHHLDDVRIVDIIENKDLYIYHSKYDYDLYKDIFNKVLRVQFVVGEHKELDVQDALGYDVINDGLQYFYTTIKILKIFLQLINVLSLAIMFFIEYKCNKKYDLFFKVIESHNIEYLRVYRTYLNLYLIFSILFISNLQLMILYLLVYYIFYKICVKKIKSRMTWI